MDTTITGLLIERAKQSIAQVAEANGLTVEEIRKEMMGAINAEGEYSESAQKGITPEEFIASVSLLIGMGFVN